IADGRIQFGLAAIKNVGSHAVETIVEMREADGACKSLEDLCERTSVIQDVNRRVLESLVQSGACDSLGERARLLYALDKVVARAEQSRRDRESGQTSLLEMVGSEEVAENDYGLSIDVAPMASEEKLRLEKELLGLYLSDHPLRRITRELAERSDTQAVEVTSALQDTEVRIAGLVREVRRVVTRKGQIMAYASLEDLTGAVDVVLHVVVGSREVTVHADRYHVLAGPVLAAEIDEVVGAASTRLEIVRPKAQANGNGRGKR